jgi:hypothetical protein
VNLPEYYNHTLGLWLVPTADGLLIAKDQNRLPPGYLVICGAEYTYTRGLYPDRGTVCRSRCKLEAGHASDVPHRGEEKT